MPKISERQRLQRSAAGSARTAAKKRAAALSAIRRFELDRLAHLIRTEPATLSHPTVSGGLLALHRALAAAYGDRGCLVTVSDAQAGHAGFDIGGQS